MNKAKLLLLLAFGLTATTASAGVIFSVEVPNQLTSTQSGVNTVDFNDGTIGSYTDSLDSNLQDYTIYNTPSGTGQSASPFGINDSFLSVPNPVANGTAEFGLGADYDYFGLFWGSVDTYNTLSFWNDGAEIASFSGSDISPLIANGDQGSWNSNRYVNFFFTDGDMYDTIRLNSTSYAFETDNHAYGVVAVPEPSIIALFGLGLLGLGLARRKART
jgi:hypothetical protein